MTTIDLSTIEEWPQGNVKVSGLCDNAMLRCEILPTKEDPFLVLLWVTLDVFAPSKTPNDMQPVSVEFSGIEIADIPRYNLKPSARIKLKRDEEDEWGDILAEFIVAKAGKFYLRKDKDDEYFLELRLGKARVTQFLPDEVAPID